LGPFAETKGPRHAVAKPGNVQNQKQFELEDEEYLD